MKAQVGTRLTLEAARSEKAESAHIDRERAVLGAFLLRPGVTAEFPDLTPEHFYFVPHQRLYQTALDLHTAGIAEPTIDQVMAHLGEDGQRAVAVVSQNGGNDGAVGYVEYLRDVLALVPFAGTLQEPIRQVIEVFHLRHERHDVAVQAQDVEDDLEALGMTTPEKGAPKQFRLTDVGNAERLVAAHGRYLRYVKPWGCWLVWDNRRWRRDSADRVVQRARRVARNVYREASRASDSAEAKALAAHAAASERDQRIAAMLRQAQSFEGVALLPEDFDTDPWLLNVRNGTIDLRTGELRGHHQSDLITKLAPVEYDQEAECPLWQETLTDILPPELIEYVKRVLGYCLTGDISEHVLPIFCGLGANGKNTILDTVQGLLGRDYAGPAPLGLLIRQRRDEHPCEIAGLHGKRLVVASEPEPGARLRVSLVKSLTGDAFITARHLRQEYFTFRRTHKVILTTNHRPIVPDQTVSIWRRLRLIPFTVSIAPEKQDVRRTERLRREWPGILAWAVRGCRDWQERGGLDPPETVKTATAEYRAEEDPLTGWLDEAVHLEHTAWTSWKSLWESYKAWAEGANVRTLRQKDLREHLTRLGCGRARKGHQQQRGYYGIALGPGQQAVEEDEVPF